MSKKVAFLSNIVPERLKEARLARGYTVAELTKFIGVSRQAINKYEQGTISPCLETINKYIYYLDFSLEYFQTPIPTTNERDTVIMFRSLATATLTSREMLSVRAEWLKRIVSFLSAYIDFPDVTIKQISFKDNLNGEEVEAIAENLRESLSLGYGPIDNLTVLLQNCGVLIAKTHVDVDKSDACSKWVNNRPIIFLNSNKSAVRSRFDLAHELGHLVLHYVNDKEELLQKNTIKTLDAEANRFASAFLLPRNTFANEIISTSLDFFIELKKRWKVSIAAMIYRCKDLGILSDTQTSYLYRQMASRKVRKNEPLDKEFPFEEPTMLNDAFTLLIENNYFTPKELPSKCDNLPLNDFCKLTGLPESMFEDELKPQKPNLRLV